MCMHESLKERFEKYHGKGSFDKWRKFFENPALTFQEIADKKSSTKQEVSKIYTKYFTSILPYSSGRERRMVNTFEQNLLSLTKNPQDELTKIAEKNNFIINRIPRGLSNFTTCPKFRTTQIKLDDRLCAVHSPKRSRTVSGYLVGVKPSNDLKVEFQICIVKIKGFKKRCFVIPNAYLEAAGYIERNGDAKHIYLPISPNHESKTLKPKNDWWQFENAWFLIKKMV